MVSTTSKPLFRHEFSKGALYIPFGVSAYLAASSKSSTSFVIKITWMQGQSLQQLPKLRRSSSYSNEEQSPQTPPHPYQQRTLISGHYPTSVSLVSTQLLRRSISSQKRVRAQYCIQCKHHSPTINRYDEPAPEVGEKSLP